MVHLVFLGKFGDVAPDALAQPVLPGDVRTLADLKAWIAAQSPPLGRMLAATPLRLAVNQALVQDLSLPIAAGDEIAFLPPMSGG